MAETLPFSFEARRRELVRKMKVVLGFAVLCLMLTIASSEIFSAISELEKLFDNEARMLSELESLHEKFKAVNELLTR